MRARQGEGSCSRPRARTSTRSRRPRRAKDFRPVALEREGDVPRAEHAPRGPVEERRRPARRLGPEAQGRVRRLHGPLGPPGQGRRRSRATRSSTARPTTPRAMAALLEIAEGVHGAADAARAVDPVPRRHGRGEGPARRQVLRRRTRSIRSNKTLADINMDVINLWGRTTRHDERRLRQLDARRPARQRARGAGRPDGRARPRAGEGLLLPLRPLRVRQAGRPRARTPRGASTTSARPDGYGQKKRDEYTENDYHKPSATR